MNPSSNEASGIQLPPPVMEQAPAGVPVETGPAVTPEQAAPAGAERAPTAQSQPPAVSATPLVVPAITPPSSSQTAVSSTTQSVTPAMTDDGDLIEKEWVNKAKQIVERTRDDPYQQSEELTVVKADYMKKRYDKTIKLNK